nr:hypothetical protein [Tanacetum cinerariifolium]
MSGKADRGFIPRQFSPTTSTGSHGPTQFSVNQMSATVDTFSRRHVTGDSSLFVCSFELIDSGGVRASRLGRHEDVPAPSRQNPTNTRNVPSLLAPANNGRDLIIGVGYPKETMGYYFYFPPKNKIIVVRYAEFLEKNLISQEVSERAGKLKEIQNEDASHSENTSKNPIEVEGEHSLGDLNEPTNYRAAMLDLESNKWIDDMNAEVQSSGIKIYQDRTNRLIRLSQSAYVDKILKRFKMDNSKRSDILMQERLDFNKTQGASTPEEVYGRNPKVDLQVDCYCDARFKTDRDDIKSQTGYVFILNGGLIDWKRSKQSTTAMSTLEAEYIAASEASIEAV